MMDDRGRGLIFVFVWFITILFALWIFLLVLGGVLEPIHELAVNDGAVKSIGYGSAIDAIWPIVSIWAPLFLGVGALVLMIIYAVFREQFRGTRRAPRP